MKWGRKHCLCFWRLQCNLYLWHLVNWSILFALFIPHAFTCFPEIMSLCLLWDRLNLWAYWYPDTIHHRTWPIPSTGKASSGCFIWARDLLALFPAPSVFISWVFPLKLIHLMFSCCLDTSFSLPNTAHCYGEYLLLHLPNVESHLETQTDLYMSSVYLSICSLVKRCPQPSGFSHEQHQIHP